MVPVFYIMSNIALFKLLNLPIRATRKSEAFHSGSIRQYSICSMIKKIYTLVHGLTLAR